MLRSAPSNGRGGTRHRNWFYTLNIEGEPRESAYPGPDTITGVRFHTGQLERGRSGNLHIQGLIVFENAKTLRAVARIPYFERAHLEPMHGTFAQAITYVTKQDTRVFPPFSIGDAPRQGVRTDIEDVTGRLLEGERIYDVGTTHPSTVSRCLPYCKFMRSEFLSLVARRNSGWLHSEDAQRLMFTQRRVILIYGDAGTGKSLCVYNSKLNTSGRVFDLSIGSGSKGSLWFDGYDSEDVLWIEDFSGRSRDISYRLFLRLLDVYPVRVQTKFGMILICPLLVIITSNLHHYAWYQKELDRDPLERRIKLVYRFTREVCERPEFPEVPELEY